MQHRQHNVDERLPEVNITLPNNDSDIYARDILTDFSSPAEYDIADNEQFFRIFCLDVLIPLGKSASIESLLEYYVIKSQAHGYHPRSVSREFMREMAAVLCVNAVVAGLCMACDVYIRLAL